RNSPLLQFYQKYLRYRQERVQPTADMDCSKDEIKNDKAKTDVSPEAPNVSISVSASSADAGSTDTGSSSQSNRYKRKCGDVEAAGSKSTAGSGSSEH